MRLEEAAELFSQMIEIDPYALHLCALPLCSGSGEQVGVLFYRAVGLDD